MTFESDMEESTSILKRLQQFEITSPDPDKSVEIASKPNSAFKQKSKDSSVVNLEKKMFGGVANPTQEGRVIAPAVLLQSTIGVQGRKD